MRPLVPLALLAAVGLAACGGSTPPGADMGPLADGAAPDLSAGGDLALPPQPPLAPGCMVSGQPSSSGGCIFNEACNHTLVCSLVCGSGSCGCLDPNNPGSPAGPTTPLDHQCDNLMDYRPLQFCDCYQ